jgi:aminoglycoside 6'-N-acetyltransferase I
MRSALWPHCTPERHATEMCDYAGEGEDLMTYVAVMNEGRLGGFIEASIRSTADGCESRPIGYVEGIFVRPEFRGQGVGRSLVASAERWARERGCREFASDCRPENEASIQFHRRIGFEVEGQLVHFRRVISRPQA